VGPRAGLDTEARGEIFSSLRGIEPRSPGRPACRHTLYWLSYPAHALAIYISVLPSYAFVNSLLVSFCFIEMLLVFTITLLCEISSSHGSEYDDPWWWRQYAPLKRRSTINLHGSTTQKTALNINNSVLSLLSLDCTRLSVASLWWHHIIVSGGPCGCWYWQWVHIHGTKLADWAAGVDLQGDKPLPRAPRQFILLPLHEATSPHCHVPVHQGESIA
jgi:hypothetical protein